MIIADDGKQLVRRHASLDIDGDARRRTQGFYTFFGNRIGDEDAVVCHGEASVNEEEGTCKRKYWGAVIGANKLGIGSIRGGGAF